MIQEYWASCAPKTVDISYKSLRRGRRVFVMFVLCIFLVYRLFWGSRAVPHSLLGTYTAVNTDEFTCVLWLDGEAVDSYNSNGKDSMPRRNWMHEEPSSSLWKSVKHRNMEHWNRGRTDILKNYTGINMSGAAVLQGRFGCEIELNSDSVNRMRTFAQYGWNGEDFLSFNLSRLQWEASAGSAVPITRKWNGDQDIMKETKKYMEDICVMHLLDSLSFEAEESQKTAQPTAAVFAKRSQNPGKVMLTCLVSGFHCRDATVEVYRDDDIITEEDGLLSSGIRPNGDGTCQLRKSLDISNSTEASYSCEVQFRSLKRRVKWDGKMWDPAEPKQGYITRRHYWWLIIPLFGFFILILGVIYIWYTAHRGVCGDPGVPAGDALRVEPGPRRDVLRQRGAHLRGWVDQGGGHNGT